MLLSPLRDICLPLVAFDFAAAAMFFAATCFSCRRRYCHFRLSVPLYAIITPYAQARHYFFFSDVYANTREEYITYIRRCIPR